MRGDSLFLFFLMLTSGVFGGSSHKNALAAIERVLAQGADLRVVTADVNQYEPSDRFDRVVSVEMFEHLRNVEALLERIGAWLVPDGRLFVHVFSHHRYA